MNMFEKYDNIPEDYIPCNHNTPICTCNKFICRSIKTIQTFLLPGKDITNLSVIYFQGLYKAFTKSLGDESITIEESTKGDNLSTLKITLTEEETEQFKAVISSPVVVQIQYISNEESKVFNFEFTCLENLDLRTEDNFPYNK